MFGTVDLYVKLTLGKQQTKSATVKNNHNPEWNFESKFDVDQSTAENIIISVFDKGLGKDDSLGSTSLNKKFNSTAREATYPMGSIRKL